MHNILIIAETQSYIIMSLKEKFEELSYKVIIVKADMEAVRRFRVVVGVKEKFMRTGSCQDSSRR